MRIVKASDVSDMAGTMPAQPASLAVNWLEGPATADRLDVGLVTLTAGGMSPPHRHDGGQVMIGLQGTGFVEHDGHRHEFGAGDIVICAPGEFHVHGAVEGSDFAHLTITTLGYHL
ncbi:MAG: cupin domain-containing protein [Acidimicrobiia bacterium]